jgi:parallel beta-helix repeat protein
MTVHTLATIADFQSTIDAAQAGDSIILPGETLSIPPGIVYIDGITIAGQPGTLVQASGKAGAFDLSGRSDITLRDIAFELDTGAHAVRADGALRLSVEGLTVTSNFATADVPLLSGRALLISNSDEVSITGCDISNTFGGIYLIHCRDALVANNTVADIGYAGINVTGERIVVDSNTISNAGTPSSDGTLGGGDGITVGAGADITLNGNTITNGLCYQINVAGAVTNMTVTNNVMRGAFTSSMYFIDVAGLTLSGNRFSDGNWLGVSIEAGRDIRIEDNRFDQAAIWLAADVWDAVVGTNEFIGADLGVFGRGSLYDSNAITFAHGVAPPELLRVVPIAGGGQLRMSSLLDGSALLAGDYVSYRLLDLDPTSTSAYFELGGHALAGDEGIFTLAPQLVASTLLRGASGAHVESIWLAGHGGQWSDWREVVVRTMEQGYFPNRTAEVDAVAVMLEPGSRIPVKALLSSFDADGDSIVAYQLLDGKPGADLAQIQRDGQAAVGQILTAYANDLRDPTQLTFSAGSVAGEHVFYARANDGTAWGAWQEIKLSTLALQDAANMVPCVLIESMVLETGTAVRLAESVRGFDGDGDAITHYRVLIGDPGEGGAHLVVNGQSYDGSSGAVTLTASAFRNATVSGASGPLSEIMWVMAFDGHQWSDWTQLNTRTVATGVLGNLGPSVIETSVTLVANATVSAASIIAAFDREGDSTIAFRFLASGSDQAEMLVDGVLRDNALGKYTAYPNNLDTITFGAGDGAGDASYFYAQAYDGLHWGDWFRITLIGEPGPVV